MNESSQTQINISKDLSKGKTGVSFLLNPHGIVDNDF